MRTKYIVTSIYCILGLVALPYLSTAQQVEKPVYGDYLIKDAVIQTVSNGTVNGDILIKDGKIAQIGTDISATDGITTIDCKGKTVYPGLIDGGTRLGLSEVGAVSLTQDANEIGDFTPHAQALTAVNPNSVAIPVTRVDGVTSALTVPQGGLLPGTASLINLVGYTPDQMYAGFQAVILNFPRTGKRGFWDRRSQEDIDKEAKETMEKMNKIFSEAKLYNEVRKDGDVNFILDALIPVLKKETKLMVEVNNAADILKAIEWLEGKDYDIVLTGVAEGWRVATQLAEAGYPVITGPVIRTPTRQYDRYDKAYSNPGLLAKAGVKVGLRTNDAANVRNLPFHAGFAAAYGMGKEEALKAVTINNAEILGVGDQLGSIEVGKVASIVVADGDIFETKTNIEHLFIDGWKIPIESRQTLLYNEFLERTPGLEK